MKPIFCLILSLIWVQAEAFSFYGNRSHVDYKTSSTQYFDLHYPTYLAPYSDQVGMISEAVFDTLVHRFGIDLPRVDLVVDDALFSNGQANVSKNTVKLWMTDWGFKLRSTHPWLTDLVTHEFAHIVTLYTGAKTPPWLFGMHFAYQDYYNEKVREDAGFIWTTSTVPMWFAEGSAQFESSRMGFDRWDAHRAMVVRVGAEAETLVPLEEMKLFISEKSLDFERGPYTQGFDLVRYLVAKYGEEAYLKVWKALASPWNLSFSSALHSVIQKSDGELYEEWQKAREEDAKKQKKDLETLGLVTGERLSKSGFWHGSLRWPEGKPLQGLSNFGGDGFEGGVFVLEGLGDSTEQKQRDSLGRVDMGAFSVMKVLKPEKAWLENGFDLLWENDSNFKFLYVTYQNRNKEGEPHFDLAMVSAENGLRKEEVLTKYLNVRHPAFSPDGKKIVALRKGERRNHFVLGEFDLAKGDWVDLYGVQQGAELQRILYHPKYSPDGEKILFTEYDQNEFAIKIFDLKTKQIFVLWKGNNEFRDVIWQDEETILLSANFNGIFNLYSLHLPTGAVSQVTRVFGGAFSPALNGTRDTLAYVGYDEEGFSLYRLPLDSTKKIKDVLSAALPYQSFQKGQKFGISGQSHKYSALPNQWVVAPLFLMQETAKNTRENTEGKVNYKVGASWSGSDPMERNQIDGMLLLEVGEGFDYINGNGVNPGIQSDFGIGWTFRGLPITFETRFQRVGMRGQDTVKSEDPAVLPKLESYGNVFLNLHEELSYSLFKKGDLLRLAGGWQNIAFELYNSDPAFGYSVYKSFYGALSVDWNKLGTEEGSSILSPGYGLSANYFLTQAELFRPKGKFYESFTVNSAGVVEPIFTDYQIHSGSVEGVFATHLPLLPGVFSFSGKMESLLAYEADSLDRFFLPALQVPGYPFLGEEEALFKGRHLLHFSSHWQFNLWKVHRGWRAFHHIGSWLDFGYHAAVAEEGALANVAEEYWAHAVSLEWRISNRIFYGIPFEFFVNLSRGLSKVRSEEGVFEPEPVEFFGQKETWFPSTLHLGIVFQFDNPGELVDLKPKARWVK